MSNDQTDELVEAAKWLGLAIVGFLVATGSLTAMGMFFEWLEKL